MKINKNKFLLFSFLFWSLALFVFASQAKAEDIARFSTQCTQKNSDGTESNCSGSNNNEILQNQCLPLFGNSKCSTMAIYLDELSNQCNSLNNSTFNCSLIEANAVYGSEASRFANYYIDQRNASMASGSGSFSSGSSNSANGTSGTGSSSGSGIFEVPTGFGLPDPAGGISQIITNFLNWLLGIFGVIAMIAFVVSGAQYFFVSADEKMAATAKKNMTYSIIGVIVALSGFVIIKAVDTALNVKGLF